MSDIERQETDTDDATWGEVVQACCCHSPLEWAGILFHLFGVAFFLYFFIVGLEILGDGAQILTGCAAGAFFGDDMNPVSGLMVGIICTVFLQSSSTTTSIVVTLVGAGAISVNQGIYMVMGSNIGTSVTNTIVAMGQMGDGDQLERAFAGATVHDVFNILTVSILFPVELITGYLNKLTNLIIPNASTSQGSKPKGFLKKIVAPLAESLIVVNKKVTEGVAQGGSCNEFYPTVCEDPQNPTKNTCSTIGLIGCPKDGDLPCPALFEAGATRNDDMVAGLTAFLLGIIVLFVCLYGLVTVLQKLLLGGSERIIYKATNINGYIAMLIGALITMALQSSSIFTSTLTPLVGLGIIRLEQMLPLTLGSNLGTCVTSILAALVTEGKDALQVALAHLLFNLTGILIWYPLPILRSIVLDLARQMGKATRLWKGFPIVYIVVVFMGVPLGLLGLSNLFGRNKTLTIVGSLFVVSGVLVIGGFVYWLRWRGGRRILGGLLKKRQNKAHATETLAYDLHYVERRITELKEHTGFLSFDQSSSVTTMAECDLRNVAIDMKEVLEKIELLARHAGLPIEEDTENLGRFWHKEKESMNGTGVSDLREHKTLLGRNRMISIALGLVSFGVLAFGVFALFLHGSTGYIAMGGLIVSILILGLLYVLWFSIGRADVTANRLAIRKDQRLRDTYTRSYGVKMAQIKEDLKLLESHTNFESVDVKTEID